MSIDWTKVITLEDKFEQAREQKYNEIGREADAHVKGSFVCSLGYPMQFDDVDAMKMEGSIQLLEASGGTEGYLTDAEDVTHYNVALADIKTVKLEMLMNYAEAHSRKQILRQAVKDATTQAELDSIVWEVV